MHRLPFKHNSWVWARCYACNYFHETFWTAKFLPLPLHHDVAVFLCIIITFVISINHVKHVSFHDTHEWNIYLFSCSSPSQSCHVTDRKKRRGVSYYFFFNLNNYFDWLPDWSIDWSVEGSIDYFLTLYSLMFLTHDNTQFTRAWKKLKYLGKTTTHLSFYTKYKIYPIRYWQFSEFPFVLGTRHLIIRKYVMSFW